MSDKYWVCFGRKDHTTWEIPVPYVESAVMGRYGTWIDHEHAVPGLLPMSFDAALHHAMVWGYLKLYHELSRIKQTCTCMNSFSEFSGESESGEPPAGS